MPTATIETRDGSKAIVELTDEQVVRILQVIEEAAGEPIADTKKAQARIKKEPTTESLILALREEGFFGEEGKLISEVAEGLRLLKGYRFETTSLSGPLLDLVRAGELRRKGKPGKFRYFGME